MTPDRVAILPRNRGEILVRREPQEGSATRLTPITAPLDSDGTQAAVAQQRLHTTTGIPDAAIDVARVGDPVERSKGEDGTRSEERRVGKEC